ncbi:ABC transporter ATP-binding protein [Stenoxybacter acetivorans]|uniref:ABC transporter ATP-binding protein n=1 Tax=Stenoxybacter acetivorans TaxID=422441 RepID=UPI00056473C2|nr:ABC transporter ATP-binding protein [Stenoxybacter acetivorans]
MIELSHLTKSYKTPSGRHYLFKDLNVHIPGGKSVGLLGRNGAGKSTLLRIIGGIDRADSGQVISDQRISWPVGLASGFQGSMTGRDNVKFLCRLYAKPEEFADKIRFVEEFAEIGKYFDMPVKTYSSGMRSRLGFGTSLAFDFDYYLIDEITAVGDASFRKKSSDLILKRKETSQFLMVSHGMGDIKKFCDMALLLSKDGVQVYDDVDEGIAAYQKQC